jgi:GWxTD domain-containing protein
MEYPDQFRLILTSDELSIFDSFDDEAKARFYSAYWSNWPDQLQQFKERCLDSDRFSTPFVEGWETDRGRVTIIYGIPDDIETYLLHGEQVPWEIWLYLEGMNESFVFADRWQTGDYEQIYSSVEGEVSYSDWESMLSPIDYGTQGGGYMQTPGNE